MACKQKKRFKFASCGNELLVPINQNGYTQNSRYIDEHKMGIDMETTEFNTLKWYDHVRRLSIHTKMVDREGYGRQGSERR